MFTGLSWRRVKYLAGVNMLIPSVLWNCCHSNCWGSIGLIAHELYQDALLYGGLMVAAILDTNFDVVKIDLA